MRLPSKLSLALLVVCAAALTMAPGASAKLSISFEKRLLTITGGDKGEVATVVCDDRGNVRVSGRSPKGGPVPCRKIAEIDALMGGGNDRVDVSRVGPEFAVASFEGFGVSTGVVGLLGAGDDVYVGSPTAFNLVLGHAGNDTASGGRTRDALNGGPGNDRLRGLGGRDTLLGKAGRDRLFGGAGGDVLSGNADDDFLSGGPGGDLLGGGRGDDALFGGPGRDRLLGGLGRDRLRGGPGRDVEVQNPPKRRR